MNGVVARCAECNYLEYLHNNSKLIIIRLLREYILTQKMIIVSVRSLIICDYLKTKNVNLGVNNQLVWYKQQNLHNGKIKNWSWLFLSKQPKPFFNKTLSCVLLSVSHILFFFDIVSPASIKRRCLPTIPPIILPWWWRNLSKYFKNLQKKKGEI